MIFYHATNSTKAEKIIGDEKIHPSEFNYMEYIHHLLESGWFRKDGEVGNSALPSEFGISGKVYWLGTGIYCFYQHDLTLARNYSKTSNAIVEIQMEDEISIFDMDTMKNRVLLNKFLIEGFIQLENLLKEDSLMIRRLKEILQACLLDNFVASKPAAGILIEIFQDIMDEYKTDMVSNTFIFGGKEKSIVPFNVKYACIKNQSSIKKISEIESI